MKAHITGRFFTIFYAVMVMAAGAVFLFSFAPYAAAQQPVNPQPLQATPDIHKSVSELSEALLSELGGIPADRGPLLPPASQGQSQDQQAVPQLYSAYATIRGYLIAPNAKDSFESFTKLCTDFPRHCMFLSEFWRVKALKDCFDFNNYVFDVLITGSTAEQRGYFESMIEQCSYGYYYDHWDDLNNSIKNALAKAKAEKEAQAAPQKK